MPTLLPLNDIEALVDQKTRDQLSAASPPHPYQPLYRDEGGVVRFKHNQIIVFILNTAPSLLNTIAAAPFSDEDRTQFAQLIGYSVSGLLDLRCTSGVTDQIERLRAEFESAERTLSRSEKAEEPPSSTKASLCAFQGCSFPVDFYCGCSRCDREPEEDAYFSCAYHRSQASVSHQRVRGYPPSWVSGTAQGREAFLRPRKDTP